MNGFLFKRLQLFHQISGFKNTQTSNPTQQLTGTSSIGTKINYGKVWEFKNESIPSTKVFKQQRSNVWLWPTWELFHETKHGFFALSSHRATQARLPSFRRLMRCERPDISATYKKEVEIQADDTGWWTSRLLSTPFKAYQHIENHRKENHAKTYWKLHGNMEAIDQRVTEMPRCSQ